MKHSLFRSSSGTNYIVPFIIVTSCFALWGFANDITNPMVKAFSKIFRMTVTEGTLVQVAFYGITYNSRFSRFICRLQCFFHCNLHVFLEIAFFFLVSVVRNA